MCVVIYHVCASSLWRAKEGARSPRKKMANGWDHLVGTGTPNSCSLEEWPVLVNTESSFQPSSPFFFLFQMFILQKFSRAQQIIKQSVLLLLELQHMPCGLSEILVVSHLYLYIPKIKIIVINILLATASFSNPIEHLLCHYTSLHNTI